MYKYDEISDMSLKLIKKLNEENIKYTALTKGILPIELAEYSKENEYGITLISLNEDFRAEMEPGAASYKERIQALKNLHNAGCKTWVSIEPYPTPNIIEQNFSDILKSVDFADKLIFGRLNYNSRVTAYKQHKEFFNQLAQEMIEFCKDNNIEFHIKEGTITETTNKKIKTA